VSHVSADKYFLGRLRTEDSGPLSSLLVTGDISDGVRCDTEISVDVVSVRSVLVARRLTPLLQLDLRFFRLSELWYKKDSM